VKTVRILGLIFRARHSWLPHIKDTKAKYLRALNVLKFHSHLKYWCNREILLPLYSSFVRSILHYGSSIYGLAPLSQLQLLDPIQNSALRLATGAFRTNTASSPCADTGIPPAPLHYRRLTLTAKFLTSILQRPKTNTYNLIFHPSPALHSTSTLSSVLNHLFLQLIRSF